MQFPLQDSRGSYQEFYIHVHQRPGGTKSEAAAIGIPPQEREASCVDVTQTEESNLFNIEPTSLEYIGAYFAT